MVLGPWRAPLVLFKLNRADTGVGRHLRHFTGSSRLLSTGGREARSRADRKLGAVRGVR